MAGADVVLARLTVQVKGVKLWDCARQPQWCGTRLRFRRDPSNPYDGNCVEVLRRGSAEKIGNVAKGAARWMSVLLQGPCRVSG